MILRRARGTVALTVVMVAAFILEIVLRVLSGDPIAALTAMGAIVPGTLGHLQLWRLIAAIFLHAGILHLLFNLWAFVQIGFAWELLFGMRRFLIAFFGTGIVASIVSAAVVRPPGAVGASGAIFGLLASFVVLVLRAPEWRTAAWTRRLAWQLVVWAGITMLLGFFNPLIDNAAHVGGAVGGALLGARLSVRRRVAIVAD